MKSDLNVLTALTLSEITSESDLRPYAKVAQIWLKKNLAFLHFLEKKKKI